MIVPPALLVTQVNKVSKGDRLERLDRADNSARIHELSTPLGCQPLKPLEHDVFVKQVQERSTLNN